MRVKFNQVGKQTNHLFEAKYDLFKKPVEIYVFIDPICKDCWALEPIIKKLQIEYGRYFKIRHITSGRYHSLKDIKKKRPVEKSEIWEKTATRKGLSCEGDITIEDPVSTPYFASIAIKAAELQGKQQGLRFLRKLQEVLFLGEQDITAEEVLIDIAKETGLDMKEFTRDLQSQAAIKAFQCDTKITSEMEVEEFPTLVLFNHHTEEEGIKISGHYSYDIYVEILSELLQKKIKPSAHPPIEKFLSHYKFVTTKEMATVYNMPEKEAERAMKQLLIKQKVERIPGKHDTFWRLTETVETEMSEEG